MKRSIVHCAAMLLIAVTPFMASCTKDANTRANENIVREQRKQKERLQKQKFELQNESIKQKDKVRESNIKAQADRDKQLKTEESTKSSKKNETYPQREKIDNTGTDSDENMSRDSRGKFIE